MISIVSTPTPPKYPSTTVFSLYKYTAESLKAGVNLDSIADLAEHCKEVQRGTLYALNAWAKRKGLKFIQDNSLFGGHYIDSSGNDYICR